MALLPQQFDARTVEPATGSSPVIEPGLYPAMIVASEMKPNHSKTGQFLQITEQIIDGPHKGAKIYDRLNIINPSAQAVEIAYRTLSAICHAVGVMNVTNSEELHGRPHLIDVIKSERNDKPGVLRNEIREYRPINAGAPQAAAAPYQTPAPAPAAAPPWQAAPQAPQAAPQAAAYTAPAQYPPQPTSAAAPPSVPPASPAPPWQR